MADVPDTTHALRMIDVGDKAITRRDALAAGRIAVSERARRAVLDGTLPKGDVIVAAKLAGIMAAKRVSEIVPLCHPLPLDKVEMEIAPVEGGLEITARVRAEARTGVEMEAMAAVAGAALTIYDMTKGIDKAGVIRDIRLLEKSGGKSGDYRRQEPEA